MKLYYYATVISLIIRQLKAYLSFLDAEDGLLLLEKAITKSQTDKDFAQEFERVLTEGSTVDVRDLFEAFGNYWERSRGELPFYPHKDAVNKIDFAIYHVRIGHDEEVMNQ